MQRALFAAVVAAGLAIAAPVASLTASAPPNLLGSICHAEPPLSIAGPHKLVMLEGMGADHMAADTRLPEAQRWFDYGLTLARSFEHADATLAFQKSATLDPHCSLCAWGAAWSQGPNINFGPPRTKVPSLLAQAQAAQHLAAADAPAWIKGLESALVARYAAPTQGAGDRAFTQDMDVLHSADPANVELAIFDAEAWLIEQQLDDDPAGPTKAMAVLQPLLAANPNASGLIHFYVHATENAGQPGLAEAYADRLTSLAPNASHMVHMPSHTYFRVGRYEEAAQANLAALAADDRYAKATNFPTPLDGLTYHFHDVLFGLAGAMMSGDGEAALKLVALTNRDFPNPATYGAQNEEAAGAAYMALGRYADPRKVLEAPATKRPFLEAMRHYARGEAYLRLGRPDDARAEAAQVRGGFDDALSRNVAVANIARLTLQGDAALMQRRADEAVKALREAAWRQETVLGHSWDPPAWWYPVRRSLAAALLAKGDAAGAAKEATTVLQTWRLDPVTLAIRAEAERKLGQPAAADADQAAANRGWHGSAGALSEAKHS